MIRLKYVLVIFALGVLTLPAWAQDGDARGQRGLRGPEGQRGPGGPGGPGSGGPTREDIEILDAHDLNGDGWLNAAERAGARRALAELRAAAADEGRGRRGRRGPRVENREPASPGPRVVPGDVEVYPEASLYDTATLRTVFLTFENDDWEAELQDFKDTDVEVPATMLVDGVTYPGVGVRFRGASSYFRVPAGYKRSLNVSIDFIDQEQRLYGYKTLNLLNASGDASMMSSVLYSMLADPHLAVPKANFVKVVINGEYWGVYVNVQQFDKIFTAENYGSSRGTRWKVPGSPRGDGGLAYDGEDREPYETRYDMKSNDGKKAWDALIELCRVLNETPSDRLVEKLSPRLDIDEALWFMAFDVAFVNSDGYWARASDYSLFRDAGGQFHLIPHDTNEALREGRGRRRPGGGPGGPGGARDDRRRPGDGGGRGGGGGGGGVTLDPLTGLDNERLPLRSRLLAVPELRDQYLQNIRHIAKHSLDWDRLGPHVVELRTLIDEAVRQDTRKLDTYEAFIRATSVSDGDQSPAGLLEDFANKRRTFLLEYETPATG